MSYLVGYLKIWIIDDSLISQCYVILSKGLGAYSLCSFCSTLNFIKFVCKFEYICIVNNLLVYYLKVWEHIRCVHFVQLWTLLNLYVNLNIFAWLTTFWFIDSCKVNWNLCYWCHTWSFSKFLRRFKLRDFNMLLIVS